MGKRKKLYLYRFLTLLFIVFSVKVNASKEKKQTTLDSLSFQQLDSLFINTQNNDFSSLELYSKKMLQIAREEKSLHNKKIAFYNLIIAYKRQGKKIEALKYVDSLELYASKRKDIYMLSNCFNFRGILTYEEGNLETAFTHYKDVIEINKGTDDRYMKLVALNNIALIKKELQSPLEALKDTKTALQGFIEEREAYSEISAMHLIGELYLDIYRQDTNTKYLDSIKLNTDLGLEKSKLYNDTFGYYLFLSTKGQWLQETKQYDKALIIFKETLEYFQEKNDNKWKLFIYLYLGRLYDELKDFKSSTIVLEKANKILGSKDFYFNDTPEVYLLLAKNYFNINNHEKANHYLEKYKKLSGKVITGNRKLYAKLHNTYNVSVLEKKISKIENKAINSQKIILLTTIISFCIAIIALFYYIKNRYNSKKLAELLEKIKKDTAHNKSASPTISSTKIENIEVKRILASLAQLEDEEYFLALSCSLNSVAKEIDTNTSYLSKIVNEYKGKSFANYLNEYRINKVLVKLKNDKQYQQYTLKYIAEQFGFSRHETFSRVFKKQTGISPSYYLKKIKHDNL